MDRNTNQSCEIHFSCPSTQRLLLFLGGRSVNIRTFGPLPTCEEPYNPAAELNVDVGILDRAGAPEGYLP